MGYDTQAMQLRAQAQEIEEAARLARASLTVMQLDTQAAQLQAQAQEAERAVSLAQKQLSALRAAQNAPVQPPQQSTLISMMPCMPVLPMPVYPPATTQVPMVGQQWPPCASPVQSPQDPADFTTLMLRNIPNSYSRDMLLKLLDQEGFEGCYDLVFVAVDFRKFAGLGYGFVNFTSHENAERAKEKFEGFNRWQAKSKKVCKVNWSSPLQGLSAHVEHYRNSVVMHESVPDCHKPALFIGGVRQAFPSPTRQIREPTLK